MILVNLHRFFFRVASLVVLFPYFQLFGEFGGIQPYVTGTFLILFLFISIQRIPTSKPYFIFSIPILFVLINFILGGDTNYLFFRNFFSYLTFSLVFYVFSVYLVLFKFPKKIFFYGILVWIIAALLQLIFGETVFYSLIASSTTSSRGAASLATEPSFFALQLCILLSILYLYDDNFKAFSYIILGFVGLALSQSIIGGWFYMNMYLSTLIYKKRLSLKYVSLGILGLFLTFILLQDKRFGGLLSNIFDLNFTGILLDSSASKRLYGAITPLILSSNNFFIPLIDPIEAINKFECLNCRNDYKLASYLGNFIFHFGFIFLTFIFLIFLKLKSLKNFFTFFFLIIFLLFEIPVAHPLVALLLVYYYRAYKHIFEEGR